MTEGKFEFLLLPVSSVTGMVEPKSFQSFLENAVPGGPQNVALVTIMFANNELGSVNPIKELVRITKEVCGKACLFHTDAAQALGKVPVNVEELQVDLLSVCGHKFYAPKGSGALYIKKGVKVHNVTYGAGHEKGIRPGTENVLVSTGMATALYFAVESIDRFTTNMRNTRDELFKVLKEELAKVNMDFVVNGDIAVALPNTLNCAVFKMIPNHVTGDDVTYISAQRLLMAVGDKVCMSAGSACHSTTDGEIEVSAPLKAVNVDLTRAIGTLRISTGRETTMADVRRAARVVARTAAQQFAE
ncbi:cysteine desulfurase [Angomonas deanei]|nr:cysteine desulfurase [Angomonas deanei]|eukprot:EPY41477.1 cysteine desulfurase [Angomonas deanei]